MIIIVPYRDRHQHLMEFVPHMRKRFDAEILVVEQVDGKPFNRGKLLNIGFLETVVDGEYYCFHDVDMLPIQADYSRPLNPTHLATKAQQFGFKMPFAEYFGGVNLFLPEDFIGCNGYPNNMWGWGGEDDKIRKSVLAAGFTIDSRECTYRSLPHPRKINAALHQQNIQLLQQEGVESDGLGECQYTILKTEQHEGYTKITVDI